MSQAQGKCCLCSSNGSVHPIPDVVFLEDLYGINLPVGSVLCCGCETLLVRFSNHFAFARRIRGHHAHLLTSGACGLCLYGGNTENFVDAYGSNVNLSTFVEMVYKIPSKSLVVANVCQPCSSSLGQFYNHWSLYSPRGNALVQQNIVTGALGASAASRSEPSPDLDSRPATNESSTVDPRSTSSSGSSNSSASSPVSSPASAPATPNQ